MSMQDERLVRQVVSRMSQDDLLDAAARVAMTTAHTAAELTAVATADTISAAVASAGVSFDAFLAACVQLSQAAGQGLAHATQVMATAMRGIVPDLAKHGIAPHVRFLPAPVRAVIRLGEQQRFIIRYDSTRAKIRRGRVFLPVELVTADGGTSLAIIGERSWVRSQIDDWQSLGFDVELYRGTNVPSTLATR